MRRLIVTLLVTGAAITWAGESEFTLDLDTIDLSRRDPRTEARLAGWNSPMGRLMYDMNEQRSMLMHGGMPGGSGSLAFRVKLRSGVATAIVAATLDGGVEFYERSVEVLEWPWHASDGSVMPIEEQLSLLLGRRLELNSVGVQEESSDTKERPPDGERPATENRTE